MPEMYDVAATSQIDLWINNDGDYYDEAQECARESVSELQRFLAEVLTNAKNGSAAWHTKRMISDYALDNQVNWQEIAENLLAK